MCEKCEINPLKEEEKEIPEKPIEVTYERIVIYPDLMTLGETYLTTYRGRLFSIAKTDLGVIVVKEEEL